MNARRLPLALILVAAAAPLARAADDATAQAASHYQIGLRLFEAGNHEQALIEFQEANHLKPRPAALFMMAQCEYVLGHLKEARTHYESYTKDNPDGEFVALANDRIQSIDKRLSTFAINCVPDDVTVHIAPEGKPGAAVVGQAPNNFQVPSGRYRIDVTKPQYQGQTRIVDIDLAETKPLFFKLDPIPARLEIETVPLGATLYVNGNRARNPYHQDVVPGHYEVFAEASEHEARTVEFNLAPGERRLLTGAHPLTLLYVQRSGRAELLFASGLIGGFVGVGAVAAGIGKSWDNQTVATVSFLAGGGLAGAVAGVLVATPFVPKYIPDNRALFILGAMWIGGVEGAAIASIWRAANPEGCDDKGKPCQISDFLIPAFVGSLPGLALGLTTGSLLAARAPTYGRVALIQSTALGGAVIGALVQVAATWKPYGLDNVNILEVMPGALIGLNAGLVGGLLGAYLPDQSRYGPTWKRVLLVDLAAGAGALAGGLAGCVTNTHDCLEAEHPADAARATSARAALIGAGIGVIAGVLFTRHFDDDVQQPQPAPSVSFNAALMPMRGLDGRTTPGVGAFGTF